MIDVTAAALTAQPFPQGMPSSQLGRLTKAASDVMFRPTAIGMTGPVDSLEVRWITPGPLMPAMRVWFARFPAGTETRDDAYLLRSQLPGLAVKLRQGSVLDLKAFAGSPGPIELPNGGCGTLELWRKWSFSSDGYLPGDNSGDAAPGWAAVHKKRTGTWFPLTSSNAAAPRDHLALTTGCAVELVEIRVGAKRFVSVGLEARGAPESLRPALDHAVGLLFAEAPPPGAGFSFSLDNSQSYAEWLHRSVPGSADLIHDLIRDLVPCRRPRGQPRVGSEGR